VFHVWFVSLHNGELKVVGADYIFEFYPHGFWLTDALVQLNYFKVIVIVLYFEFEDLLLFYTD